MSWCRYGNNAERCENGYLTTIDDVAKAIPPENER